MNKTSQTTTRKVSQTFEHMLTHSLAHIANTDTQLITNYNNALVSLTRYVTQRLTETYTSDIDVKNITRYLKRRMHEIVIDLYEVYATRLTHRMISAATPIQADLYRQKWGRMTLGGSQSWAAPLVLPFLVKISYEGHSGMCTGVEFSNRLRDVFTTLRHIHQPAAYVAKTATVMRTKINTAALKHFADRCPDDKLHAEALKTIASVDVHGDLVQDIKQPVMNRVYLQGLNIQQMSKQVRSAALRGQYSYDVVCAVFAVFAAIAHEVTGKACTAILDYINDRSNIRTAIVQESGLTLQEVKDNLISVGFGKKARNNNQLVTLLSSPTAKKIVNEFRRCSRIVNKTYPQVGPFKTTRGRHLAHLFFVFETELMQQFVTASNETVNAWIHDAVVFIKPVDIKHTLSKIQLSYTSHKEYFVFEETQL